MKSGRFNGFSQDTANYRGSSIWTQNPRVKMSFVQSSISVVTCVIVAIILTNPYVTHQTVLRVGKDIIVNTEESQAPDDSEAEERTDDVMKRAYQPSLCLTPGCIKSAAEFLTRGNFSADPCRDFYNYACGKYASEAIIPDQEASQSGFQKADEILINRIKNMLEDPSNDQHKVFKKVHDYYLTCMNKTALNQLKGQPLIDLLNELGGWPAIRGDEWAQTDEINFDWTEVVSILRRKGVYHDLFFEVSVGVDIKNGTHYIIGIDEPSLGMPGRKYLLKGINDKVVQKYLDFIVGVADLLGGNAINVRKEMTEAVLFEMEIAKICLPEEEKRDATKMINKRTLKEVNEMAPYVDWVIYVNNLLIEKVDEKEVVNVVSPKFLENLINLFDKTPTRTLANYIMWRVALSVVTLMDDRFRRVRQAYAAAITGQVMDLPRWKICLDKSRSSFGDAVGAMYIRRYLSDEDKKTVTEMVTDVNNAFQKMLDTINWMENTTRDLAHVKANDMKHMLGYPPELLNDTMLDDYYRNITVIKNKFFETSLSMNKEWIDHNCRKLRQPHIRSDWRKTGSAVARVNAFYSPQENLIMIPAAILSGVFFSSDRPRCINYGALGVIIGHEITHGFDDRGKQFDNTGNLKNWWQNATAKEFKNNAKCIVDQYSKYKVEDIGLNVNGINTQGENIADNGGIKEAYKAYENWVAKNGEENQLPGLNLTSRQIFWLSFGNVWCSKYRHESMKLRILTDSHSPPIFRVNGVVSNSVQFARDFNCPAESPMNPSVKCAVW